MTDIFAYSIFALFILSPFILPGVALIIAVHFLYTHQYKTAMIISVVGILSGLIAVGALNNALGNMD